MKLTNIFIIIYLSGVLVSFLIDFILEKIDFSFRKKHGLEIPKVLEDHVEKSVLEKTCRYEDAKYKIWLPSALFALALDIYLVFSEFYPAVFATVSYFIDSGFAISFLFLVIVMIPDRLLSVPFSLYREFGIEKQFGFSRMTFGMWFADGLKGLLLSLVVSAPLVFAANLLFKHCPEFWWILLGALYIAFSLGISVVYPLFIAPIFNKFTPLEDGELKDRLESLLKKCGFTASGLFVMDASRRSGHSNAYFTGFGKSKRVVLYDTLIEQLTPEEIEAVLGHELGHYRNHHIVKRLLVMIPLVFAVLFAISFLLKMPFFYESFGFLTGNEVSYKMMVAGLFLVEKTFGSWGNLLEPAMNFFSRRDEFQADSFSKEICGTAEPLISALIKLNKENLSEIQVPKVYAAFNYNHPPLLERIEALQK